MSGILAALAGIKTAIATAVDEYFNRTTLLLNTSSTNGAQNNTFLDSSTNNFTITRNGNTTQGTFTPFSQTGWSNYFNGSTDYLSVADNAAWYFTGDFTVEAWVYLTAYPSVAGTLLAQWVDSGGTDRNFSLTVTPTGMPDFAMNRSATSYSVTGATAIPLNTWTHVAGVLNGTSLKLYVNGTSVGTPATVAGSANNSTAPLGIGAYGNGSFKISGYISNARVVSGSAVYTANFTPSTTPLTAITNTSLLTCQSNRFLDTSTNAFAITANGTPSVQAFSPFLPTAAYDTSVVGGSGYFDGSGDYLSAASNAAFAFGTGDFEVSFWFYPTVSSQDNFDKYFITGASVGNFVIDQQSTANQIAVNDNNSVLVTSSSNLIPFSWNHVVISRVSTTLRIFLNGTQVGSVTNSTNFTQAGAFIGANNSGTNNVTGYFSGIRVVKGSGVSSVTVPTAPPTAITNTQLLLNFTNAGIFDSAAKNVLETVGNAQVSTTQAKWGTTSMYFDGTGDWLTIRDSELLEFGSGDFTVEAWVYPTLITGDERVLLGHGSGSTNWVSLYITSSATVEFAYVSSSSTVIDVTTTSTVSLNTWTHIALVRNGTSFKIYINGTDGGSSSSPTTSSSAIANFSDDFRIGGARWNGGSDVFQGYMDDFRISKYARYTANFTAPTAAFPLQ
jgi:Concanavalin A-like lectin/glucanases superfamily